MLQTIFDGNFEGPEEHNTCSDFLERHKNCKSNKLILIITIILLFSLHYQSFAVIL